MHADRYLNIRMHAIELLLRPTLTNQFLSSIMKCHDDSTKIKAHSDQEEGSGDENEDGYSHHGIPKEDLRISQKGQCCEYERTIRRTRGTQIFRQLLLYARGCIGVGLSLK